MNSKKYKCRGATSLMAVIFVSLFGTLSVSFYYVTSLNVEMARNYRDVSRAYAMSESGLEYAQMLLAFYLEDEAPYTFNTALTPQEKRDVFTNFMIYTANYLYNSPILKGQNLHAYQTFNEGGVTGRQFLLPDIQVQNSSTEQFSLRFRQYENQLDVIEITCTGIKDNLNRTAKLDFSMSIDPPSQFDFAIFGRDSLALSEGVTVDGYNYEPGEDPLAIGSLSINAGSIALNADVTINGDVEVAPGGDPDVVVSQGTGASVTGDVLVRDEDWSMPVVKVPTALETSFSQGSINNSTTINASGKYNNINLGKNDVLTIDGDVKLYVTGDISLGQAARIEVNSANPDAKLTLYMGGDLVGEKDAALTNASADATRMVILGLETCQNFELNNSGLVHAAIYTPDADVIFNNNVELYGSVVAGNFTQNHEADVHYDAQLRDLQVEGVSCDISVDCLPNSYTEIVLSVVCQN